MSSSVGFLCIIITMATLSILTGASNQYKVGDAEGWRLPDVNNTGVYKIWAIKFTFYVGDSIVSENKNDSVVKVDKRGYYHCNETSHGSMFKDGHTVFLLEKPGFYYFVSGDLDHCNCKKGQRLMIEVKGRQLPPSIAAPPLFPRPSAAISWIIPSFGTLMALEALAIVACYGPYLA